jgi:hypothetical protein
MTTTHLTALMTRLDALNGVRAALSSGSELIVEANGRKVCHWVPDGAQLTGAFSCEAAKLCANTVDEAYRLTVARI